MQVDYGPLCPFYFLYNYPYDKLLIWSSILLTHLYTHFRIRDVILWTVQCCISLLLPKEKVLVNCFLWHPHLGWWGETSEKKRVCLDISEILWQSHRTRQHIFLFLKRILVHFVSTRQKILLSFRHYLCRVRKYLLSCWTWCLAITCTVLHNIHNHSQDE